MMLCLLFWLFVPDAVQTASELDRKGAEAFALGNYDEAARHQKRALVLWNEVAAIRAVDLDGPHFNLAQTYLAQGKLSAAQGEAELSRSFVTPPNRDRVSLLFAQIYFQTGNYAEAEQELRAVLPNLEGTNLATVLNDLGMVRAALGNLEEARRLLEDSLSVRQQTSAAPGPDGGRTFGNLALVRFRQGDLPAAATLYSKAIPLLESRLGPEHPHLGMVLAEYSQVLRKLGNKSEAKRIERRAKAILATSLQPSGLHSVDLHSLR
ncbi:MAG TPA: tetratricopeptide repeat protein [Bryobacteraceae bacterium]|nr:tetratricopeptide repeat protein [Bryobacteraceae bacterium]